MSENTEYRYLVADGQEFGTILQAQLTLHMGKDDSFSYKGVTYDVTEEGDSLYSVSSGGRLLAIAYKDIISSNDPSQKFGFNFSFNALKAHANGEAEFTANGKTYTLDEDSVMLNGEEIAYISRFVIQSKVSGTVITKDFKERVQQAVENGETEYTYVNDAGQEREIKLEYNPAKYQWSIKEGTSTRVFDAYSFPSSAHWLGTDKYGMFVLDFATSIVALGKTRVAMLAGKKFDEPVIVDPEGRLTNDPNVMWQENPGALLAFAKHKGSGLCFACELMAGILSGGETIQPAHPRNDSIVNNMTAFVIDPAALCDLTFMRSEMQAMIDYVKSSHAADPVNNPVLMPGEPERIRTKDRLENGIEIADGEFNVIKKTCLDAGVDASLFA